MIIDEDRKEGNAIVLCLSDIFRLPLSRSLVANAEAPTDLGSTTALGILGQKTSRLVVK